MISNTTNSNSQDIDLIIYWVDGNDPKWQEKKRKYQTSDSAAQNIAVTDGSLPTDTANNRYRDWNTLPFLFRGIEKNMPWVRKIFFVSDEQLPPWLNIDNSKLVLVDHKDFIPSQYLPVFSANPIELNFHRIPGISEQFIVFNDDFFVLDKVSEQDFFRDGKPVDILMEYPIMCSGYTPVFSNMLANGFNLVGKYYDRKEYRRRLRSKILSPSYGAYFFYNLIMYFLPFPKFFGLLTPHFARPYLKSSYETLWEKEYDKLDQTCHNRFRDRDDVNIYVFRNYNILSGNFVPGNIHKLGKAYFIKDDAKDAANDIRTGRHKLVCINDDVLPEYYEACRQEIVSAFESIYPEKSSFEK